MHAREQIYDGQTNELSASGDVRLQYAGMQLQADRIHFDFTSDTVQAEGQVTVRRGNETLVGDHFEYSFGNDHGRLDNATISVPPLIFRGRSLQVNGQQLEIINSEFTTCDRPQPHYKLTAEQIEFVPGDHASLRRATFWYHHTRLFTLPKYTLSLKKGKRSSSIVPRTYINGTDKLLIESSYAIPWTSGKAAGWTSQLSLGMSLGVGFRGGLDVHRETTHWEYGTLITSRARTTDPFNSKLRLNQLPEIYAQGTDLPTPLSRVTADVTASWGNLREEPTMVSSDRLNIEAGLRYRFTSPEKATQINTRLFVRKSWYRSMDYRVIGLDFGLRRRFGPDRSLDLHYLTHDIHGATPFQFDDINVVRELHANTGFPVNGNWRLELDLTYDVDNRAFRNKTVGIVRTAHCLEYGISWDQARSEAGLIVGLRGLDAGAGLSQLQDASGH